MSASIRHVRESQETKRSSKGARRNSTEAKECSEKGRRRAQESVFIFSYSCLFMCHILSSQVTSWN